MGTQKIDDDLATGKGAVYNQDRLCFLTMMWEILFKLLRPISGL